VFVDQTGESVYDTELVKHNLLEETLRVGQNVGFVANLGISRRIVGKDNKHQKWTAQKTQIQL
jgi:hypothetical protein